MSTLEQMYQQVIMDHARRRLGFPLQPVSSAQQGESHQINTSCGDEITLRVGVDSGILTELSWEGQGCSISQAAASAMVELLAGKELSEVNAVAGAFRQLMQSRGQDLADETMELLGDAGAFVGVGRYPARVKCALLGWMALADALIQAQGRNVSLDKEKS